MFNRRSPHNTTAGMSQTPERLLFLAAGMADRGPAGFIEAQEAAGQREMVNSTVIPAKVLHSTEKDLTDLGFTLGPVVEGDPMFREATLPTGWKREGSDHSMWSYIVDQLGRRRCSIFYKAAFYDRDAHISAASVDGYVSDCSYNDKTPVLDDEWATRNAVLAAIDKALEHVREQIEFWEGHGKPDYVRDEQEKATKYEALRAEVEGAGQ